MIYLFIFLRQKYGLWNQLTQQILAILVIDLPIQLTWISKKWGTMVSLKSLFSKWTAVREEKTYYLTNLVFSKKKMDSYYSVPTLGHLWTYVKQGWCYKVWELILTWYINLLTFSYPLHHLKKTKKCFVTNWEHSWAFHVYVQSIVSNYFLNTLTQTSNIYLGWSLQFMWFFWFISK